MPDTSEGRSTQSIPIKVDFAHLVDDKLLIYGWVAGLSSEIVAATLTFGSARIDLLTDSIRVTRTDVSSHLGRSGNDHDHGFLLLYRIEESEVHQVPVLLVEVKSTLGITAQARFAVKTEPHLAMETLAFHERSLRPLIGRMPLRQLQMLAKMGGDSQFRLRSQDLVDIADNQSVEQKIDTSYCALLPDGVLVACGSLPSGVGRLDSVSLVTEDASVDITGAICTGSNNSSFVLVDSLGARALEIRDSSKPPYLEFVSAAQRSRCRVKLREDWEHCWKTVLHALDGLDENSRLHAIDRLWRVLPNSTPGSAEYQGLDAQQRAAVQSLPRHIDGLPGQARARLYLDSVWQLGKSGMVLSGWADFDECSDIKVTCHVGTESVCISSDWVRVRRADVTEHLQKLGIVTSTDAGFLAYIPFDSSGQLPYLSVRSASGSGRRLQLQPVAPGGNYLNAIRSVLATVNPDRIDLLETLNLHIGPAVQAIWSGRTRVATGRFVESFGSTPEKPTATIVVPLFGRHDFADYQLALFADDPAMRRAEIIYVVDDPGIVSAFRHNCPGLYRTYGLPFVCAYPGANLGFAGATNFGATLANAPYLLMLNSDVMPARPGWLDQLIATYKSQPKTGVLGAKLIYEDGSIQHAGMVSRRYEGWGGLWINEHLHKGLNPSHLKGVQSSETVTAACALIDTELFRSVGGLSEDYIIGDFEDSDLCHRVRAGGRTNRVALDVALYHLERQSQAMNGDVRWRQGLTLYNCWLHNSRWSEVMERLHR